MDKHKHPRPKIYDDLTIEQYWELRSLLKKDQLIADHLYWSIGSLNNWKKANNVYTQPFKVKKV